MPADAGDCGRFLVVGASGFVGRHLMARLARSGIPARGTRSRSGKRAPVESLTPFDLDTDRIRRAIEPGFFESPGPVHAVIAAAVDDMDWCLREASTSRRIYVDGIRRLVDDLLELGSRPIFFSTCYVFDGREGGYTEGHPVRPINEYARQKLEIERHLAARAPASWTLRLDKIVGDDPAEATLFTQWWKLVREARPIVCIADSELSPTYVGDVTEAVVRAAGLRLTGLHHVANPERFTRADLARAFCRSVGQPDHPVIERPLAEFGFADARALKSSLDGSRFVGLTGLRHTPMSTVMSEYVRRLGDGTGYFEAGPSRGIR